MTNPLSVALSQYLSTYRKSASGNTKLGIACGYCSFKLKCWPELKQLESRVSQAKIKPTVDYVHIGDDK
jgi:hypothetical protein